MKKTIFNTMFSVALLFIAVVCIGVMPQTASAGDCIACHSMDGTDTITMSMKTSGGHMAAIDRPVDGDLQLPINEGLTDSAVAFQIASITPTMKTSQDFTSHIGGGSSDIKSVRLISFNSQVTRLPDH